MAITWEKQGHWVLFVTFSGKISESIQFELYCLMQGKGRICMPHPKCPQRTHTSLLASNVILDISKLPKDQ